MLRASSLGLSLISPTTRVIRPCPSFRGSTVWPLHAFLRRHLYLPFGPSPFAPSGDVAKSDEEGSTGTDSQSTDSSAGTPPKYREMGLKLLNSPMFAARIPEPRPNGSTPREDSTAEWCSTLERDLTTESNLSVERESTVNDGEDLSGTDSQSIDSPAGTPPKYQEMGLKLLNSPMFAARILEPRPDGSSPGKDSTAEWCSTLERGFTIESDLNVGRKSTVNDGEDSSGTDSQSTDSPAGMPPKYQEMGLKLLNGPKFMAQIPEPLSDVSATEKDSATGWYSILERGFTIESNLDVERKSVARTTTREETPSPFQRHRAAEKKQHGGPSRKQHSRPWHLPSTPPLRLPYEHVAELSERLALRGEVVKGGKSSSAISTRAVVRPLDPDTLRMKLLYDLSQTSSSFDAWQAYCNLVRLEENPQLSEKYSPFIPLNHLHRLSRLLIHSRPKTRALFRRLLTVLSDIQARGGTIKVHEWNALINHAGRGTRKTSIEDFDRSLSIFTDMVEGRQPGRELSMDTSFHGRVTYGIPVEPDIYTYTTLVNIAARTLDRRAVAEASALLKRSLLLPNRLTLLSMLRYYSRKRILAGVKSTLSAMRENGFDLGIDGVNACIWAYGRNKHTRVVEMIYCLLRHNISPRSTKNLEDIATIVRQLREEESIVVPHHLIPDEVTYTLVIQIMAYSGDFVSCITVFTDMLSSQNKEKGAPLLPDDHGKLKPTTYSPTIAIYRAIFLGFSRHAVHPSEVSDSEPQWDLNNLTILFDSFIEWSENVDPGIDTINWIILAFDKASGRDFALLRKIYLQLERHFNGPWGGKNHRLRRIRNVLFPQTKK